MFDDDPFLKSSKKNVKNLEPMSLAELRDYVDDLKAEIVRTEQEISKKGSHMNAASALFKTTKNE